MKQIRFTREGFEKLKQDYEDLKAQRPEAVEHLKRAREMGDLSENGYYKASRAKLSSIDRRLYQFSLSLKQAVIIDKPQGSGISVGSIVTLFDGKKEINYTIVGDLEAHPLDGKISLLSPLGRAIEGKKAGDEIVFRAPSAEIKYKIISVS